MKKSNLENQSGRSMIEMLGVLAIIGVLSVGGIAGYSKAMYRYRLNKTIAQITQIAGNIRSFFALQKSYSGLSSESNAGRNLLKKAKLVPEDMWDGNSLKHPFGDSFIITSTDKILTAACRNDPICNSQAFSIKLYNLSEVACIDLITQDWSNANVIAIGVYNPQNPALALSRGTTIVPPVKLEHAVKLCAAQTNIDYIRFLFDNDITGGDISDSIKSTLENLGN